MRKFIVNITTSRKNNIGEKVTRVSLEDFKGNILELNRLCRKNGSLLVLISHPICKEYVPTKLLHRGKEFVLYKQALLNISKEYNIPLVSIPEMTEESDDKQFFLDAIHPNPLGHRMIMEKLYDYLIINNLLPLKYTNFNQLSSTQTTAKYY